MWENLTTLFSWLKYSDLTFFIDRMTLSSTSLVMKCRQCLSKVWMLLIKVITLLSATWTTVWMKFLIRSVLLCTTKIWWNLQGWPWDCPYLDLAWYVQIDTYADPGVPWLTECKKKKKCKETSNFMWYWFWLNGTVVICQLSYLNFLTISLPNLII